MANDFRLGEWLVQPSLNSVSRNGSSIHLEPKVMEVLGCLASRSGETVPKDELLKTVWPDTFVTDDGLVRAISELRRVFGDDAREPRFIQTIPKRGYRLVVSAEWVGGVSAGLQAAPPAPVPEPQGVQSRKRHVRMMLAVASAILLAGVIASLILRQRFSGGTEVSSIHSLAVLPLQNLSGDPTQEYFSDGMTDALITDLAQISSLKVISRTSSMQYKGTKKFLPEIARELNVDGIVEGTVQRSGDRVRITAQLIQAASDKHLWANGYERDLRDVFALERDITDDIAHQVQARLRTPNPGGTGQPRPVDPRVLEAYVQGNYHLNGRGRGGGDEEPRKAREYFQQAIALDPEFAPAYLGLAEAHNVLSYSEPGDLPLMRSAAERAVALDPTSSPARNELGMSKLQQWDWLGAEADFRQALALNSNNADAHDSLATVLDIQGRLDEGWKEYQIAQELDPNHDHLAFAFDQRGEVDKALEIRTRIAQRDPLDGNVRYFLALNYAQKQMFKEFTEEMGNAATLYGLPDIADRLQHAYDQSGGQGSLRQWAKELEHLAETKQLYFPGALAEMYAALGDRDRAFFWLEQFRLHRDLATADPTTSFKTDPWFAPLRSDPRFADFLRRIGLPP